MIKVTTSRWWALAGGCALLTASTAAQAQAVSAVSVSVNEVSWGYWRDATTQRVLAVAPAIRVAYRCASGTKGNLYALVSQTSGSSTLQAPANNPPTCDGSSHLIWLNAAGGDVLVPGQPATVGVSLRIYATTTAPGSVVSAQTATAMVSAP